MFAAKTKTKTVRTQAEAIAEAVSNYSESVPVDQNPYGLIPDFDRKELVHHAISEAENPYYGDLEMTYRGSGVRIVLNYNRIAKKNNPFISQVQVFEHPFTNKNIDYKELQAKINAALAG